MTRPFSHSSLSSYEQCPARYKFSYVDNINKPYESIESFLGRRVHESLEFLYSEIREGLLPLFDGVIDHFTKGWNEKWHKDVVIVKKRFSTDHYFKLGTDCLGRYYRKHKPFASPVKEIEYTVLFKMDPEDDFQIKGIIDRLDYLGDGKWEIHDYKTSSRSMSQADANQNRQLALYQLGIQQVFDGVKKVDLVWHFLRHGEEVRSSRTVQELQDLKTKVRNLVSEIRKSVQNGSPFPPQKSPLCNWCFYWEECPAMAGHNPVVKRETAS